MAKKEVTYQISMDKIRKAGEIGKKKFIRLPDPTRLQDGDFRKYLIKRTIIYILLSAFCVAFLLLLSASTSPLYNNYCDGDSSIFMVVGKAIAMGRDVYRDYFDHKGPILFYLNALGFTLTGGKDGVFIVQCVFLSLTAIFMYKTARIFTKTVRSIICVVATVLAFAATISDGNLSEEYCMLLCVIPIYFAVKYFAIAGEEPHPPLYSFVYGVCFALCAFIRINNGVMIGGVVLVTLVTEFISGRVKDALINLVAVFIGMVAVAAPVCIFFAAKGLLGDMIFATFTFNFLYAAEGAAETSSLISVLLNWTLPILVLIGISLIFAKRLGAKVASLITTVSVFALIPALMGFAYTHYYTTLIPLISLYCAVFFYIATRRITFWSVMLCVAMMFPLSGYFANMAENVTHYIGTLQRQQSPEKYRDMHTSVYYSAKELSERIPEEDRDSVFGYDVAAAWFLEADIMPCYRLFTLQESWAMHYPEFGREINEFMIETPPKWVVIHNIDIIGSSQFLRIIRDEYELDTELGYDLLYKRREK